MTTIARETEDAIGLELEKLDTVLDMAESSIGDLIAPGERISKIDRVWMYTEEAIRGHVAEIRRLLAAPTKPTADLDGKEAAA